MRKDYGQTKNYHKKKTKRNVKSIYHHDSTNERTNAQYSISRQNELEKYNDDVFYGLLRFTKRNL